jgi:hypothetical protein
MARAGISEIVFFGHPGLLPKFGFPTVLPTGEMIRFCL